VITLKAYITLAIFGGIAGYLGWLTVEQSETFVLGCAATAVAVEIQMRIRFSSVVKQSLIEMDKLKNIRKKLEEEEKND